MVIHFGGNDVLPERLGEMHHRISAAITGRGNEMVYHDWEELYNVSSSSATAFPKKLRRQFSAAVVDRGYSILFRDHDRYRTTILPKDYAELSIPVRMRGFYTTMRAYKGWRHVVLVSSRVTTGGDITLTEDGVTVKFTVIPIPPGTVRKAYLYCLLSSFIQPSLDPSSNAEIVKIKASLKERYPEQYTQFSELE